jgi:hypothetical protein
VHGASGRIQFTSILTLLLITVGGYFAYALVPAYADNYTLKQDLSGVANQAWHKMGKEELQKQVIDKASAIGSHVEIPVGGLPITVKGLPVGDDEVTVLCTDPSGDCSGDGEVMISVNYGRIVELPYLKGRFVTLHFSDSAKETLKPVEW